MVNRGWILTKISLEKDKLGERLVWRRISRDMDRFREG